MDSKHNCKTCGKHFTTLDEMKVHKKIHVEDKSYKCEFCDKICSNGISLKKHLEVHSGQKKP